MTQGLLKLLPMHAIPVLLTSLRLALAPLVVVLAYWHPSPTAFVAILLIALLSDIFDGVTARGLGVATPALRTYDSLTDVAFYTAVLLVSCVLHGRRWLTVSPCCLFLTTEVTCHAVSLVRFGTPPATHSYAAKGLGLVFFTGFALILGWGLTTPDIPHFDAGGNRHERGDPAHPAAHAHASGGCGVRVPPAAAAAVSDTLADATAPTAQRGGRRTIPASSGAAPS